MRAFPLSASQALLAMLGLTGVGVLGVGALLGLPLAGVVLLAAATSAPLVASVVWVRRWRPSLVPVALTRTEHLRLFEVVDEITAAMGMAPLHVIYADADVNASATVIGGQPAVIIGMPLLATDLLSSLRSTLGHELGHHHGGDLEDLDAAALRWLQRFAAVPGLKRHPLSLAAGALARRVNADVMRRSRQAEHRADQWGAFVSGAGTTETSLRDIGRVTTVWMSVEADLERLVAMGRAPRNVFSLLRRAWEHAEQTGEFLLVDRTSSNHGGDASSHPTASLRGAIADQALQKAKDVRAPSAGLARDVLSDPERIEVELTRRLVERATGGRMLPLVDDNDVPRAAMLIGEGFVRWELSERVGAAAESLSLGAMLQLIHDVRSGKAREATWLVSPPNNDTPVALRPCKIDRATAARWLELLLDAAVAKGMFPGLVGFGVWRRIDVLGQEWYVYGLAGMLARPNGPWAVVLDVVKSFEAKTHQ